MVNTYVGIWGGINSIPDERYPNEVNCSPVITSVLCTRYSRLPGLCLGLIDEVSGLNGAITVIHKPGGVSNDMLCHYVIHLVGVIVVQPLSSMWLCRYRPVRDVSRRYAINGSDEQGLFTGDSEARRQRVKIFA